MSIHLSDLIAGSLAGSVSYMKSKSQSDQISAAGRGVVGSVAGKWFGRKFEIFEGLPLKEKYVIAAIIKPAWAAAMGQRDKNVLVQLSVEGVLTSWITDQIVNSESVGGDRIVV